MRIDLLPPEAPDRDSLRRIREGLGLSQAELAGALGFKLPNGELVVRRWEKAPDFHPTNTAWQAIRYLVMVVELYEAAPAGERREKIAALLPECLR